MRTKLKWVLAMAVVALAGCGSSSDDDDDGPTTVDGFAAYRTLATEALDYAVSGEGSDGSDYHYTLQLRPGGKGDFPRNMATSVISKRTLQETIDDGTPVQVSRDNYYYDDGNLVTIGAVSDLDQSCRSTTDGQVPPSNALVPSQGGLYNYVVYDDCMSNVATMQGQVTWSIENMDDALFYCQTDTESAAGSTLQNVTKECHEVTGTGTLPGNGKTRFDFTVPNDDGTTFTLTATSY